MTIGVQLICVPLSVADMIPGSMVNYLWLPILLYEVPLGIWLIAKGAGNAEDSSVSSSGPIASHAG